MLLELLDHPICVSHHNRFVGVGVLGAHQVFLAEERSPAEGFNVIALAETDLGLPLYTLQPTVQSVALQR